MAERITRNKEDRVLKDVLEAYLPETEELLIASGYFYFSGFDLIHSHLKDKKIKILCGIDTDNKTLEMISLSNDNIRDHWFKKVLDRFQKTNEFESKESYKGVELFVEKVRNGSLEIKFDPDCANHSKEFILNFYKHKTNKGMTPGVAISGSSNFTFSGLTKGRGLEGNWIARDKRDMEDSNEQFNFWWNDSSTELLNKKLFEEFNEKVYKKSFIGQSDPTPHQLFIKVLNSYFPNKEDFNVLSPSQITQGKFKDLLYQVDAIEQGLSMINKHNGAIIADVVGLGKSIIASCIAKNLNKNTLIICKPASENDWKTYKTQYGIEGTVISKGKLHRVIENRMEYLKSYKEENLIIIDEAHDFKNDLGIEFAKLHEICAGNKVLLLTATPMSNDPADTCNLIKLFQEPGMTTLQTIDNLSEKFKEIKKKWKTMKDSSKDITAVKDNDNDMSINEQEDELRALEKEIKEDMRILVEPVLIRRSRIDLEEIKRYKRDLKIQKIEFPKVNKPRIAEYSIDHVEEMYEEMLMLMRSSRHNNDKSKERFVGARYMAPHPDYLKRDSVKSICDEFDLDADEIGGKSSQENLSDMMRRLVSRRFESSPVAFLNTLKNMLDNHNLIRNWYEKAGVVPIFVRVGAYLPDIESILDENGDIIDEIDNNYDLKILKSKGGWWIKKKYLKDKFINTLHKDISLLERLNNAWKKYIEGNNFKDTKLQELRLILDKELKRPDKRKVVLFTEYADTANYLYEQLEKDYKSLLFTAKETSKPKNIDILKMNFDASAEKQMDEYELLIATDTISEGKNLHRAGTIINYDLPYNPTKVVQRIGRINRISEKMFDELYIYNFFPTKTGENVTKIKALTGIKKNMFNAVFGDDTKALTEDETLSSYIASKQDEALEESADPLVKYSNLIWEIREKEPEMIDTINKIANKKFIKRIKHTKNGLLCFNEKGGQPRFRFINKDGDKQELVTEKYLQYFEAVENEKSHEVSDNGWNLNKKIDEKIFETRKISKETGLNKKDAIKKLKLIIQDSKKNRESFKIIEYLDDLLKVIQELDSLPPYLLKIIKKLRIAPDGKHDKSVYEKLMTNIKPYYLKSRIHNANKINNTTEHIIIKQELVND